MTAAALERDPARLGELVDTRTAAVSAEAAPTHAAERHVRLVVHGAVVDVRHAGVQSARDREAALLVARDDAGREAVLGVVRDLDGLVDAADGYHGSDGPERLFAHDLHVTRDVRQDSGLEEQPFVLA